MSGWEWCSLFNLCFLTKSEARGAAREVLIKMRVTRIMYIGMIHKELERKVMQKKRPSSVV